MTADLRPRSPSGASAASGGDTGGATAARARALTWLAGLALVAAAVLALPAAHWLAGRTVAWFDMQNQFGPLRWIADEALRHLRLPLWNPFSAAGIPFFADVSNGVLHPVSLVTAWLGTTRSVDLLIGGHLLCAGLGATLLALELGASMPAAAAAGVAYGTSGFVLGLTAYLNLLAGAGTLPLCLAGLRRFAGAPTPGNLALGVAATAAMAFSGDPQALMLGAPVALVLAVEAAGWRGAARAAVAGGLGLLVAAVQLYPAALNIAQTVRSAEQWRQPALPWSFAPWRLVELVLPGLFWSPTPFVDPVFAALAGPGRWPEWSTPFPLVTSVCIGLLPAALAAAAVRDGRRGRVLAALALVLLWVSLGPTLGASGLLEHVPLWRAFQYPEKAIGALTLVLAVTAGLGVDAVVERRVSGWLVLAVAGGLALAALGAGAVAAFGTEGPVAAALEERLTRGALHLVAGLATLGAWLAVRRRLSAAAAGGALATLLWGAALAASPAALRPGDPQARLHAPGPRLDAEAPGPRIATLYTTFEAQARPGEDPHDASGRAQAGAAYPTHNVRFGITSLSENGSMVPLRIALVSAFTGSLFPEACRRFGTTHFLLEPPASDAARGAYAQATSDGAQRAGTAPGGAEIWAVPHRPWASFPREVRVTQGEQAALGALVDALRARSDAAVVESWVPLPAAPGRVLSVARGLEALRIEAEAPQDATLVVSDAWWPGWEAIIDGRPTPILRADALVRAVRWPAGRHVLEMAYHPPEVLEGEALTALGILALCAACAFLAHRRRAAVSPRTRSPDPGR